MQVELLLVPGCPNAETARTVVSDGLNQVGNGVTLRERVGDYPSPTVLVDGVDVMTGRLFEPGLAAACRLDVPTVSNVVDALRAARSDR